MNNIKRIIQTANTNPREKYNILTFPTHERYETQLSKTGHNFYALNIANTKKWNENQTPIPPNYHTLPQNQICEYLNYDFILVQSRYWQFQFAHRINQNLQLPIIVLDHTLPADAKIDTNSLNVLRTMVGDINVFISDYSKNAWAIDGNTIVIKHGIDTESFKPLEIKRDKCVLTVANEFVKRNHCLHYDLWCEITSAMNTKIVGDNPGLSESAKTLDDLVSAYNSCQVYFNTSTTPIPMSLLEAMSCGCAVVTVSASMMPEIIKNGVNGFITNDKDEMKKYINEIMNDDELRNSLGNNARQTILEQFSESKFTSEWNKVFNKAYEVSIS
jgi:glycosyltransferase involved in cell wall biosynthesis